MAMLEGGTLKLGIKTIQLNSMKSSPSLTYSAAVDRQMHVGPHLQGNKHLILLLDVFARFGASACEILIVELYS